EDIEATAQTVTAVEDIEKAIALAGTDIDGDPLTYIISALPSNGYLFQTSDGTTRGDTITSVPTTVSDASHRVIYLSAIDGNGDGHGNFGFKVNDGSTDSEEATVIVNVAKVNDAIIAVSQVVNVNEDINKTITLAATNVDGDTLSYKISTLPANGYLFQTSDGTTRGDTITSIPTTLLYANHQVIYISAKDGNGVNYGNFGFKVNDGTTDSEEAIVTTNVLNVNDLPSASVQTVSADEDIDKTIILAATDVDGDTLSYKISSLPANGYLFQTSDGTTRGDTIISTPTTVSDTLQRVIYISAQDGYGDGHGNFGFKANDGAVDSEETTITVNVAPKVEDREAIPQTVSATEDKDVTITLIGADKDGDPLTYKITTLPVNGNLFETNDGMTRGDSIASVPTTISGPVHRIIYISAKDGNGDGHGNFGFKVNDGTADGNESIVTINVNAVNDLPTPITIISPADSSQILITMNNKDTSRVVFDWTASSDVENNELTYIFEYELKMVNINNETINYYDGKDLLYPGLIITYSEILENLDQFLSAGATISWSVDVTDGIDTVFSTDERVIFVIGKYAALAVDETTIPNEYSLNQNYPNPFNPTTRIQYSLPETGLVQISIYTLMGQKIATLVNRNMNAGTYIITWNGMDDLGNPAGAGLYLYQLQTKDFVKTRKMV
ncbi:MAG: Ig-like domain-containing protein, partial [Candidatus Marinimicrobia bacterium]|nr:Ig-like domain-containing protein [Candidatus Neomarinimicrobiota bacterium]